MPYTNVSLVQMRGLVRNQLGAAADTFWRDDELNMYINEALQVWNALTGYWKVDGVALGTGSPKLTVSNQVWYTIPNGTITSTMRLRFNNQPMTPSALDALDQGRPYWESETTTSGGDVPTIPQIWGIGGLNLISIWPADAAGGNALWADGIAVTPVLTSDSDYIDIGSQELGSLLDYCQHVAVFKEGGQEWQATLHLFQEFLQGAANTNAQLLASAPFRVWMGIDQGRASNKRKAEAERVGAR